MPAGKLFQYRKGKKKRAMTDGQKALKAVRKLNRKIEPKYNDVDVSENVSNLSHQFVNFVDLITLGDGATEREGNQINLKRIEMIGSIESTPFELNASLVRFVMFIDKQTVEGVTPLWTDVMEAVSYNSNYNYDNRKRFKILHDKTYRTDYNNTNGIIQFKINKNMNDLKVLYNGLAANFTKNAVFMYAISNQTIVDRYPLVFMKYRVIYDDL